MDNARPIIIVRKKGGHGGHHGGAWKVAYADFVTAMMALFIVLWLLNSSKQVQEAVGGYFKDPTGTSKKVGSNMQGAGENFVLTRDPMPKLKEQLLTAMKQMTDFEKLKSHIDMTVTAEGLRIELSESASGTFFNSGSAKLNADGAELLITLAQELGGLPNKLSIEGHTDSQPYAPSAAYGNWELSTDRANAARRVMQSHGIRQDQIRQVRGFADQRLRKADAPLDPANRRISVIVQYIMKANDDDAEPDSKAETKHSAEVSLQKKGVLLHESLTPLSHCARLLGTSMTFARLSCATLARTISTLLFVAASAFTAAAQNPTETGLMINGPDARAARLTTIGTALTAPDTGAIQVNVFAERNGTRVDRQALLKLIDRTTQRAVWTTTDDRSQGVFANISYGTYDVEASAVGYFSTRHEVVISPAISQMVIDMVLQRDPDAVSLDVGTATLSPRARKETKHAVQAFKSGKLKDAEKHLEEAYKSAPSDANLNFLMGYLYFQKKDFARAINYLNTSTSANAHNAQALTLLGRVGLEQSDYPVARSALEQAVLADAENWLPHNLLAFTYLHQRDYARARDEARVSITKDKNAAVSSQLILGEALLNLGQSSDGVQALRLFLDQAPQHPLAEQVRKAIAQVDQQKSNIEQVATLPSSEAPVASIASLEGLPSPKFSVKPWMPPGIDEVKAAVAPDVACPADTIIDESSKRAQELVANVSRFAAIEDLFHQSLDEFGNPYRTETRKYNYVAAIAESEPGYLAINEYRSDQVASSDYPDKIASTGFAGLAFVFHPDVRDSFEMKCEGLGDWHGQATWLVHFRQRDDRPNRMHSYKVGDQLHPVKLKGRAWITSDKFQIVRMEAEMVAPMPEIELQSEHQVVEYGPIPFPQKATTLWLPKSAEIYFDFRKHRYYRRHSFDHYMLFSVDTEEKHKKPVSAKPPGS